MSNTLKILIGLLATLLLAFLCSSCHHTSIETKLKAAVQSQLSTEFADIDVSFSGANGTLSGTVSSEEERQKVLAAAQNAAGFLFPIKADLKIAAEEIPTPPPAKVELQQDLNEVISLENIEFDNGKATIKPTSNDLIEKAAAALTKGATAQIQIEGHTDNTGNAAKNQTLSEKRAQSVKDALIAKGVPNPDRLSAKGFGSSKPIADNNTAEGRAKNRRVVFVVQ